jgi:DNA replication protein DnaC
MKDSEKSSTLTNWNEDEFRSLCRLAGIPTKFLDADMEKIDKGIIENTKGFFDKESFFIYGDTGVGKTYLVNALLIERMKRFLKNYLARRDYNTIESAPVKAIFVVVPQLLMEIKATFVENPGSNEMDIFDKYSEIPCLILDDIGAEKTTEWVVEVFNNLIDYRDREMKQTIFTSNLDIKKLANKLGDRIGSRIAGMCGAERVIHMRGKDRRLS